MSSGSESRRPGRSNPGDPAPAPTRHVAGLPYHDVLTPQGFELFCAELLHRSSGFSNVLNYGTTGHAQMGVDIIARRDEQWWAFQCKRVAKFGASDFKEAYAATTLPAERHVLVLSTAATPRLTDAVREAGWELWDAQSLDRRVAGLGDDAFDLVVPYFGRELANAFLGKSTPDAFLSDERFFAPYLSTESPTSLDGPFINQLEALDQLKSFVNDQSRRALVLSGPIGVGKTKLLYEFVKTLVGDPLRGIAFVREGSDLDDNAIATLPPGVRIVIVDDPTRVTKLGNLISHLARATSVKIIVGTLAGKEQNTAHQLESFGFEPDAVQSAPRLHVLKRSDAEALALSLTGISDQRLLELIFQISSGSPLVIRIIAAILNAGDTDLLNALRGEQRPMDVILHRFERILAGRIPPEALSQSDALGLMNVLSALGPIDVRTTEFRDRASSFLGWDETHLVHAIGALEMAGIVVRVGSKTRVIPEILRMFILKRACMSTSQPTQYPRKLVNHFGIGRQLLLNLALTDQVVASQSQGEVFEPIWGIIRATVGGAFAYERATMLDEIADLSCLIPEQMLELVEYLIHNPAKSDPNQPLKHLHQFENSDVLEKLPEVLKGIAMSAVPLVRQCVRFLWTLSKDEQESFSTRGAFETLADLASYGRYKAVALNLEVLKEVAAISAESPDEEAPHLAIDIVEPVLARSFHSFENVGATLRINRHAVSPRNVSAVRREAIEILAAALRSGSDRLSVKAIDMLVKCLERPDLDLVPGTEDEVLWREEQRSVLDLFRDIMQRNDNPVLRLRLATRLSWHAYRNADEIIRVESAKLIAGVEADPELDLYASIYPDFARHLPSMEPGQGYSDLQAAIEALLARVATRLLAGEQSPTDLLNDLATRFAKLRSAGLKPDAGWLFLTIANHNLSFAEAVADEVIGNFAATFGSSISSIVHAAWRAHPDVGYRIATRAAGTKVRELQFAVANALWWSYDPVSAPHNDVARRAEILGELLCVPDAGVKEAALHGVGTLLKADKATAIDLMLSVDVGDDPKLTDEVFANLRSVNASELDERATSILLTRLHKVKDLDYWTFEFLRQVGSRRPGEVLRLFRERIVYSAGASRRGSGYKPVPYAGTLEPHIAQFFEALRPSRDDVEELLMAAFQAKRLRFWFAELFANLAVHPDPLAAALSDWVQGAPDASTLEFVAEIIRRVPSNFLFEQRDLVVMLIEAAVLRGDECIRRVESSLYSAATGGLRSGVAFEPMPQDVELVMRSRAAAGSLRKGSRSQRFFERLEKHGRSEIERNAEEDEDLFGPPE